MFIPLLQIAPTSAKPRAMIMELQAFAAMLPPAGRLMGLDVGTKTIGVAVSDATRFIATPLETIQRQKLSPDLDRLAALAAERQVAGIVIGLPVNMDGTMGPRAQSVRQFAKDCGQRLSLPIALWDERWSTAAVTRQLIAEDASRKKRAEVVDRMAAAYILQGALDYLRGQAGGR